jgi:hypothetical protein
VGILFMCTAHIGVLHKADLKDLTPVGNQMTTSVRPLDIVSRKLRQKMSKKKSSP